MRIQYMKSLLVTPHDTIPQSVNLEKFTIHCYQFLLKLAGIGLSASFRTLSRALQPLTRAGCGQGITKQLLAVYGINSPSRCMDTMPGEKGGRHFVTVLSQDDGKITSSTLYAFAHLRVISRSRYTLHL